MEGTLIQSTSPAEAAQAAANRTAPAAVLDGLTLFTSLSRAMCGEAGVSDVGSLVWMMVRQMVPCEAMAVFVHDEVTDTMVNRYAAGAHAGAIRQSRHAMTQTAIGWSGMTRRAVVNAETILEPAGVDHAEPHRCWVSTVPLVHDNALTAVVALYASQPGRLTEQHAQILELLTPRLSAAFAALETRHNAADPVEGLPARRKSGAGLRIVKSVGVSATQPA
jgi:GAF domain-containing protein